MASLTDWGYNSVDVVMRTARQKASHSDWHEISIKEVMGGLEGDSDPKWNSKWNQPKAPTLPFILSICGSMAVANSFPHDLLHGWDWDQRKAACTAAMSAIQSGMGVAEIPSTAFEAMRGGQHNVLVTDDFKVANNYGCEYGGLRSWLSCNLAEFTLRVAQCWPAARVTDGVPILARLYPLLRDGALDRRWCEEYDRSRSTQGRVAVKNDSGAEWSMTAAPLLWLQITMLDTWIGRRADIIMGGSGREEVSVPADIHTATLCAQKAVGLKQTTGWKTSRIDFTLLYLRRLAEGADGCSTTCMSAGLQASGIENRLGVDAWGGMSSGTSSDWAAVDAVLTLRAFLLHLRLELMNDSSIFLRLRRFNPVVNLA
ncbi:hypothetical protein GLOTRDRAFT_112495 [Gloeophyllum trabeum ATCC 11539]|uniref:Uncharacterized protein n=1 Tax=Gloeophyllum trabeum (strain ATCC 11539 / FP-39264 / Madison 617) TaxID=670483 RepID=S7PVF2_GLOTA|nr:uncharacterized protein GLOTRDRAFT_112495 [Gloeophyllum trabeum ATCC 11539]EPQ51377.1 hypothetical protein GLOTRDRAFT_112495 [Gloeophyllum trabeum ATCC 11539]